MTAECSTVQLDLLRAADGAAVPAELQDHLAGCPLCRDALAEMRTTLDATRAALAPRPLAEDAVARILRRAGRESGAARPLRLHGVLSAAAAVAMFAVLLRGLPTHAPAAPEIAAAYDADPGATAVASELQELSSRIEPGSAGWYLPWSTEDDWDTPAPREESGARVPGVLLS